jgi:hypothetical protein
MNQKRLDYELDVATNEFLRTYNSFRDAAVKLMNIMNIMKKNDSQDMISSADGGKIHEFMIQMMDESDYIVEKCFDIRCVAEEKRKE